MMNTVSKTDNTNGKNAVKIGSLMENILAGYGLLHNLGGWRIVTRWTEIVGEKIADVSNAIRFSNDTLLVSVPDDGWRQQLSLDVDDILEKVHAIPGGKVVKKIHFIS
jgi:predicted nucleic acid-binding Zn ribbon protein